MGEIVASSRRKKIICIKPELVLQMLRENTSNLPQDTEYREACYDIETGCFKIKVAHPSFEEVPEGELIPILPLMLKV